MGKLEQLARYILHRMGPMEVSTLHNLLAESSFESFRKLGRPLFPDLPVKVDSGLLFTFSEPVARFVGKGLLVGLAPGVPILGEWHNTDDGVSIRLDYHGGDEIGVAMRRRGVDVDP